MDKSNRYPEIEAPSTAASDNEETAKLRSLSAVANDEIATTAIDDICEKLDELIALSRSINAHLEQLVSKQNTAD